MNRTSFFRFALPALAVVLLAVCLFAVFSTSQANAQWQIWYFSDVDSGEDDPNGDPVYVMYKGDNDNETASSITIPDNEYRIWIADEAVSAGTVIFNVTATCYWNIGLGIFGPDTDVVWTMGSWDPVTDTFSPISGSQLVLNNGEYLAVKLLDSDWDTWDVNVRVTWDEYPPFIGTYIAWSCDTPPYPVPDVYAWLMFIVGGGGIAVLIWHIRKKTSLRKQSTSNLCA